jgi:translocation and assembly module TamB
MKSRRWVASSLLLVAFLFALIFFLLSSSFGSQLLWNQLVRIVPGLQGELISGSLADGWQLRNIQLKNESVSVSLKKATAEWSLPSLLAGQMEIKSLVIDGLTVSLHNNPNSQEPLPLPEHALPLDPYLSTPMPIALHKLSVSDFSYDDSVVQVKVKSLQTAAKWQDHTIEIQPSASESVDVWLKPAAKTSTESTKKVPLPDAKTADLPEVFVPFDIRLNGLSLKQGRYHQPGFDTGMMNLDLQARFDGAELTVQKFAVQQEKRSAVLTGKMTFIQHYPLDAALKLTTPLSGFTNETARTFVVSAMGDLQQLAMNATLDGKEKVHLQGKLAPLALDLPFEVKGDWLSLPLPAFLNGLSVAKGKLDLHGSLRNYELALESSNQWLEYPNTQLNLALRGTADKLDLQKLLLNDGHNQLVADGQLNWQKGVHWKGRLDLKLPDLIRWLPDSKAALSGKLIQEFHWQENHWVGDVSDVNLTGIWNGFPLSATGAVRGDDKGFWQFKHVAIENGPNLLTLDGQLDKQWSLTGKLRASNLSAITPQLSGSIDGDLKLNGSATAPMLAVRLAAPALAMSGQSIRELELTGHATLDKALPGQLQLRAKRWSVNGSRLQNVLLTLSGNAGSHKLSLVGEGKQLNGALSFDGHWANNIWQGQLLSGAIGGAAGQWRLSKPTALRLKSGVFTFKSHCWLSSPSQLCFDDSSFSASRGKIPFSLSDLNTQRLTPWLPDTLEWNSALQAKGTLGWNAGAPDLSVLIYSQQGEFQTDKIHTPYRDLRLQLDVTQKLAKMLFVLNSSTLGDINVNAQVANPLTRRQLSGTVQLTKLQLYGVAPLIEALHSTKGQVDINGRLAGTLNAPLFYGKVNLKDGEVDTETEMLSLRQINGTLIVEGDKADLNTTLRAGKGMATMTGWVKWPDGVPVGQLSLNGNDIELAFAGYGRGKIDTNIQLLFDSQQAALSGEVVVPWARVDVKSLPENGIELSDDVHIVRPQQQQTPVAPFPFTVNLDLTLGKDVQFSAMGLKTALGGGLRFRQKVGQNLLTQGEIRLVNGRFKAYGQNLVIRSGKLMFNGDISDPYVMAEAIRDPASMEDTSVTVGVKINSPITAINAQVFSEPELPDTDKLSYLLRGRSSTATTNGSTEESMAAMMIGAGLGQTNGVVSDVASNFGLKDAGFDTSGSGSDTKVNLSAYLLKDLQLQYGVGVYSAVSEVKLKYFLLPQLYLQAVSGLDQAVDIFYKFEF